MSRTSIAETVTVSLFLTLLEERVECGISYTRTPISSLHPILYNLYAPQIKVYNSPLFAFSLTFLIPSSPLFHSDNFTPVVGATYHLTLVVDDCVVVVVVGTVVWKRKGTRAAREVEEVLVVVDDFDVGAA
jgi:hypothetical protein